MLGFLLYLIPVIGILWFLWKLDADLTTLYYEKFGQSPTSLRGKVIWVTGASSGIGATFVEVLATIGAKLVLSGTREGPLMEVKRKCHALNPQLKDDDILFLPFDVTDIDGHEKRVSKVISHFGKIDILVNNAGRMQVAAFEDITSTLDRANFDCNVFGPIALTRLVVKHWLAKKQTGQLVVMSSGAGKCASPIFSTYAATKHALHGYFESLRVESWKKGISVTMICPGPTVSGLANSALTSDVGKTFKGPGQRTMPQMSTLRCAQLLAVATANKLDESWIVVQPILIFMYMAQYFPTFTRWLLVRAMTEKQLEEIKSGNY